MNKLLGVLSSLALVVVILSAGVFGYKSFLNIDSSDNKTEEVTKKEETKKEKEVKKEEPKKEKEEVTNEQLNNNDQVQQQLVEQPQQTQKEQTIEQPVEQETTEEPKTYETEDEDKISISELRETLGPDVSESEIEEAKQSGNYINDEEERGDVGMDMEQQQRNIDALKEADEE